MSTCREICDSVISINVKPNPEPRGSARPTLPEVDPLAAWTAAPPDETPEQRVIREAAEAEAKKISDEIDERLRRERENEKKKKRPVKLLLLGQSESGKTATLKNFQLTYARREWAEERAAWRSVIFLNFVRNVNLVSDHLNAEMSDYPVVNHDESQEDLSSRARPFLASSSPMSIVDSGQVSPSSLKRS
ncbi:hypothetical protein EST38_g3398 [Candolleomyces aberdarensis]|uniref:Guanine nucleotide-binding protein alpha-4 subunit n=1 Tax=Candolleomyces aberdarensis TaxID=2316362 RepID=A0A4Q2DU74_9AGAR|nr:hypothetical protein EST38_g3398 [Candolleomyces aberdarensis]